MARTFFVVAIGLCIALAAACSSSSSSGTSSGALVCGPDGSCPTGYQCVYSVTLGCDAPAVCVVPTKSTACSGILRCACDGSLVSDCETPGYAPKPVAPPNECPMSGDGGSD